MVAQTGPFEWQEGVQRAWSDVAAFLPRAAACLTIMVIGWAAATVVAHLTVRLLRALHLARLVDRAGLGVALARAGVVDPVKVLSRLAFWAVELVTAQLALSVFGPNALSASLDELIHFVPRLIAALAIVLIAGLLARAAGALTRSTLDGLGLAGPLGAASVAAVWIIGGFAALDQLGIAPAVVRLLFGALVIGVTSIAVIKFGVGGIWAARDRFWPEVYDHVAQAARPPQQRTLDLRRRSPSDNPLPDGRERSPRPHASGSVIPPS